MICFTFCFYSFLLFFFFFFFFFNDTATTEIYTLSLHDALPISVPDMQHCAWRMRSFWRRRSEEHTSELQSQFHLVCRLLLEKKKTKTKTTHRSPKKTTQLKAMSTRLTT